MVVYGLANEVTRCHPLRRRVFSRVCTEVAGHPFLNVRSTTAVAGPAGGVAGGGG